MAPYYKSPYGNNRAKHHALLGEMERRHSPSTDALKTCFEVLSLAAAIDRDCSNRLAPHKLSEGKFVLLFLLHNAPDGLSPHELSERAGVTRATITGLLDGLERDGFLKRHADSEDRRKLTVRLTSEGAAGATAFRTTYRMDCKPDERSLVRRTAASQHLAAPHLEPHRCRSLFQDQ